MSAEAKLAAGEQRMDDIERRLGGIENKLDSVIEAQSKQKGFIAGFSMAFTILAGALAWAATHIWRSLTNGS